MTLQFSSRDEGCECLEENTVLTNPNLDKANEAELPETTRLIGNPLTLIMYFQLGKGERLPLVDNAVDGLSAIDTGFLPAQVLQFFDAREILATA